MVEGKQEVFLATCVQQNDVSFLSLVHELHIIINKLTNYLLSIIVLQRMNDSNNDLMHSCIMHIITISSKHHSLVRACNRELLCDRSEEVVCETHESESSVKGRISFELEFKFDSAN